MTTRDDRSSTGSASMELSPRPPACLALAPPANAVDLLAEGLSGWRGAKGGEARWKLERGVLEVVPGTGDLLTTRMHSDCQLHLEFWLPHMPWAHGQDRANSGIYVMGRYELQVLDSAGQPRSDDSCGALYKRAAPLQDATLPPETWQSMDIALRVHRPGLKVTMTVFHNGLLIHDDVMLDRPTPGGFESLAPEGPLLLQDHGAPIRFRNLWLVPLEVR